MASKEMIYGRIIQTAYVVKDIEASIPHFSRMLGVGGWLVIENVEFAKATYRGKPFNAKIKAAIAYQGDMQYELIQQMDDTPSVYRELIDRSGYGYHHLCYVVKDLEAEIARLAKQGYGLGQDITTTGGGRAIYADTVDDTCGFLEIMEDSPGVRGFIDLCASLEAPLDASGPKITRI